MKEIYQKISFEEVKSEIERILSHSGEDSWELVPDHIHDLADKAGIKLRWRPVENWAAIERGYPEIEDKDILDSIFLKTRRHGRLMIITDECFKQKQAYQIASKDLEYFISEIYPELHQMDFFQPFDCIFILRDIDTVCILHHEGHATQFKKAYIK